MSPFIPGDPDNSSLPVGGLEYSLENTSKEVQETIFSYHARNFLSWGKGLDAIKTMPHGFILHSQVQKRSLICRVILLSLRIRIL